MMVGISSNRGWCSTRSMPVWQKRAAALTHGRFFAEPIASDWGRICCEREHLEALGSGVAQNSGSRADQVPGEPVMSPCLSDIDQLLQDSGSL
jgi:hypothetical protein